MVCKTLRAGVERVIFTCTDLKRPNGLTSASLSLADALIAQGVDVEFWVQFQIDEDIRSKYCVYRVIPAYKFTKFIRNYESSRKILKPFREATSSIIYPVSRFRSAYREKNKIASRTIIIAASLEAYREFIPFLPMGSPVIGQIHTSYNGLNEYNHKVIGKLINRFDAVTVLSEHDAVRFREEYGVHNVIAIPNIVDMTMEVPYNERPDNLVFFGRLSSEKQATHAVDAIAPLLNSGWDLNIYGDGPEISSVKEAVSKVPIAHYKGVSHQPQYVFNNSKINILTSQFEGFGMSVVEAAQCGVPTVAYNCSQNIEDIVGECGVLVQKNNVEELSAAIEKVINDAPYLESLSSQALTYSQIYKPKHVLSLWKDLFVKLSGVRA
ncbi:glycosyltransferase [Rothia terrae]|uniref:glycosyltransferase n=1 Tax=Rothia terrae TaxID=396015 RepID=UPI0033DAF935